MITERLINPADYTPEILASIARIQNRMRNTLVSFTDDDIKVFEHEDTIYILANPVLGEEPIFDEFGQFERMVPMYNITLIYDKGKPAIEYNWSDSGRFSTTDDKIKFTFTTKVPRLRVLRPDLCDRIAH